MFCGLRAHKYVLSLVAAAACWGTATVISKRAVEEIAPLTLLPIELAVSVTVVSLVVAMRRERIRWSPELRGLGVLGVLNPGLSYALSLAGLARVTASMSVLLWAVEPLLILAFAYWVLAERVSFRTAFYAASALVGVGLVVFQSGNRATAFGVALTIAGVASCAVYTVLSSKYLAEASSLSVVLVQQVAALAFAVALLLASLVVAAPGSLAGVSGTAWLSALAAGALYYGVAFWFYVSGLRGVSAGHAAIFINLVPVFGLAASYAALHERMIVRQWVGALVIVGAVIAMTVVQARGARPAESARRAP
jgi:drug/metabolite transporter (DMT)-like permease